MTTDNTTPLEPCAFCGAPGAYLTSNGHHNHFVECEACGANGPVCATEAKAAGAWNRRTPAPSVAAQPAPQELIAAAQEVLDAHEAEAKADATALVAAENYSNPWRELQAQHETAVRASNAEKRLRAAIGAARASSTGETR